MCSASTSRLVGFAGASLFAAIAAATLVPAGWQMRLGLHWLVEHFLAYFVLTTMFCLAWHRPMAVAAVAPAGRDPVGGIAGADPRSHGRRRDRAQRRNRSCRRRAPRRPRHRAAKEAGSTPPPGQKLKGGCWRGPSKCDVSSPDGDESATARNSGPDRRRHDRRRCADRRAVDDQYRHGRYRGHGRAGGGAGARGLGTCPHHGRPRRGGRRRASHQRASRPARGRSAARRRLPL